MKKSYEQVLHLIKVLYNDMDRCDLFRHASAMAYVTLLSLVPCLAAVFAFVSLFSPLLGEGSVLTVKLKDFVLQHLTASAGEQVVGYMQSFLNKLNFKQIGFTGFVGILVSFILLLRQIEIALNRVFIVRKERSMLRRFIYFWTVFTLGAFIMTITVGFLSGFDLRSLIGLKSTAPIWRFWGYAITPLSFFGFFTLLYKLVPNCFVSLRDASRGAGVATILHLIANQFYGLFVINFTNYRVIYGALAAIPIFLFWIYVLWLITLFGAVVAWRSERGFRTDEELFREPGSLEKLRNHELQIMLPFFLLCAVHNAFQAGTEKGISGRTLAGKLHVPTPWIEEALEVLIDLGYIVASNRSTEIEDNILELNFFPTQPANQVNIKYFMEVLYKDSRQWLKSSKTEWPKELTSAADWISIRQTAAIENLKLSDFFAKEQTV